MDWGLARRRWGWRLMWGRAQRPTKRVQGERSERAHAVFGTPAAIGRAEQRSGARIRAGACLSVASLRPTPGDVSSARHPEGARPLARLSFAYLFFGEAKKSKARGRRTPCGKKKKPAASQTQKAIGSPFLCLLSFGQSKGSSSANRPKPVFKPQGLRQPSPLACRLWIYKRSAVSVTPVASG